MKFPFDYFAKLRSLTPSALKGSMLGIDIGTSSAKIVQLSLDGDTLVLDTYGEIDLGPYADHEARKTARLEPEQKSEALLGLLRTVDASSRRGGISIPLSSTLISFIQTPQRSPEQMRILIPSEAKEYIPVPIESVTLDWVIIPDNNSKKDAFARAEAKKSAEPQQQNVMLIAIAKDTTHAYETIAQTVGITAEFYEVELFSAIRSCMRDATGTAMLIDLGASTSKLCVANRHGIPIAVHIVATGGEAITESIMRVCKWSFEKAEEAKRAAGLYGSSNYTPSENVDIRKAITDTLAPIFIEVSSFIKDAINKHEVDIGHIVLFGGGACMLGIAEYTSQQLQIHTEIAQPFGMTRTPIILEDVLREVGPKFAVAIGVALRAMS